MNGKTFCLTLDCLCEIFLERHCVTKVTHLLFLTHNLSNCGCFRLRHRTFMAFWWIVCYMYIYRISPKGLACFKQKLRFNFQQTLVNLNNFLPIFGQLASRCECHLYLKIRGKGKFIKKNNILRSKLTHLHSWL